MTEAESYEFLKSEKVTPPELDQTALEHGSMMPADPLHGADAVQRPCSASYPLFKHMLDTYNLTLIEDELQDIIAKSDEARMKSNGRSGMVRWALVCALYHLDTEQLHELGDAIAKHSGGTYSPNKHISKTACAE